LLLGALPSELLVVLVEARGRQRWRSCTKGQLKCVKTVRERASLKP
jgi:hypothetical protein